MVSKRDALICTGVPWTSLTTFELHLSCSSKSLLSHFQDRSILGGSNHLLLFNAVS